MFILALHKSVFTISEQSNWANVLLFCLSRASANRSQDSPCSFHYFCWSSIMWTSFIGFCFFPLLRGVIFFGGGEGEGSGNGKYL